MTEKTEKKNQAKFIASHQSLFLLFFCFVRKKNLFSIFHVQPRLDDSTSDDSSQTLQTSTVTTQMSQTHLFPTADTLSAPSNVHSLRRLHSYPSGSDTDTSPPQQGRQSAGKPPVPERNTEVMNLKGKRIPPPPPPRTSSRSPLASPTSPNVDPNNGDGGNSSGNESNHSQDSAQRQMALELRHQELLKKQKQLQEQYARLQQISKNSALPAANDMLSKTGSETNLPVKMGLNMSVSGSMKNLNADVTIVEAERNDRNQCPVDQTIIVQQHTTTTTTTKQVYETDIL